MTGEGRPEQDGASREEPRLIGRRFVATMPGRPRRHIDMTPLGLVVQRGLRGVRGQALRMGMHGLARCVHIGHKHTTAL